MPAIPATEVPAVKPATHTTQFWLTIVAQGVFYAMALLPLLKADHAEWTWIDAAISGLGMVGTLLSHLGYGRQRTQLYQTAIMAQAQVDAAAASVAPPKY